MMDRSQVYQAIHTLYNGSNPDLQKKAHNWLIEFQRQTEAWDIAFQLMQDQDQNLQFFGAHTLQIKIGRDWNSIPVDSHEKFKEELLRYVHLLANSSNVVKRKICLALVYLIVKMVPAGEWENCVISLFNLFNPESKETLDILLEVLTMLPEECNKPDLSSEKFSKLHSELLINSNTVLTFIQECFKSVDNEVKKKSAKCLQSWIQFGIPVRSMSDTISSVFELLHNEDCFEEAVEVLTELLAHKQSSQFEKSICESILSNLTIGRVRQRFDEAYKNSDENFIAPLCKILVSFGETFANYLIKNFKSSEVVSMLDILLKCTDFPGYFGTDEEISDKVLSFWYMLQEAISENSCGTFDISSSQMSYDSLDTMSSIENTSLSFLHADSIDNSLANAVKEDAKGLYRQLVRVLLRKGCLPPEDVWNTWGKQTRLSFKTFRRDLSDTLLSCYYIIGDEIFTEFVNILNENRNSSWMVIESVYFGARSISEIVDSSKANSKDIYSLFMFIFTLFPTQTNFAPALRQSFILFFGSYSPWLHSQSSDLILNCVSYLVPTFNYNSANSGVDLATASFRAFQQLCSSCKSNITPQAESFVGFFLGPAVESLSYSNRIQFAESIGQILQALSPSLQKDPLLKVTSHLFSKADGYILTGKQEFVSEILNEFSCVASIIKNIQILDEDPETGSNISVSIQYQQDFLNNFSTILAVVWPLVEKFIKKFPMSENEAFTLQNFFESFTLTFQTASGLPLDSRICSIFINPELSERYLKAITELIISCFESFRQPIWLDLASFIITTFGDSAFYGFVYKSEQEFLQKFPCLSPLHFSLVVKMNEIISSFVDKLTILCHQALIVESNELNQLAEQLDCKPDLAESLMSLWSKALKDIPSAILFSRNDNTIQSVLHVAVPALVVQHTVTFKVATNFWLMFLTSHDHGTVVDESLSIAFKVKSILDVVGQQVVLIMLDGILYFLPRSSLPQISDIFCKLLLLVPDKFRIWLRNAFLSDPNSKKWQHVSQSLREQFQKQVLGTRHTKKIKDLIRDLALKARGLDGTPFANV